MEENMDYNKQIKGAVYFPSRAYNAYQTWMYFDRTVIARDFGYAKSAGLNALLHFYKLRVLAGGSRAVLEEV